MRHDQPAVAAFLPLRGIGLWALRWLEGKPTDLGSTEAGTPVMTTFGPSGR
jgi:hypothetical protein